MMALVRNPYSSVVALVSNSDPSIMALVRNCNASSNVRPVHDSPTPLMAFDLW